MNQQGEDRDGTLVGVRAVLAQVGGRSEEIEQARRLPVDLVDVVAAAGCFGSLVPRSHGGAESDVPAHMRWLSELSAVDGSVGWTVMLGSQAPIVLGMLPRSTFDAIYATGPDVVLAGTFNPAGAATPVQGGYRVKGRWTFASGCQHAHWFIAHCVVDDGREPALRMAVLPARDVEVDDTWWVSGMRGTGSHDFTVNDVFVAEDHTFSVFEGHRAVDGPLWRIPELSVSTLMFGAVAVGIASGALCDIAELAAAKTPAFSPTTLGANPLFQNQYGQTEALLRAARAALDAEASAAWARAVAGDEFTPKVRARIRATTTWVTRTAASIVDAAYSAGGSSAIYDTSPLQRRLRDIHALTQHFAIKPDTFTLAGAVLLDQDPDISFL